MPEIDEILRLFPAECRPTEIRPLGAAGGLSGARFWQIVAPRGTLVLRCWPPEHPSTAGLQLIHAVLAHAASKGIKILPVPIATSSGATFIDFDGRLWELAPWLPGIADYERSPQIEKLRAALRALAEFHIAVADFPVATLLASSRGPAAAVTQRLSRLRDLQSGGLESLERVIDESTWPKLTPVARALVAELPRIVPLAVLRLAPLADRRLPTQPCIRDIWHDHVLFDGDKITGLVDFGGMQIDTPATDVARLLGSLIGDDAEGWREGLAAYSALRSLSHDETLAVFALDAAGTVLAGSNWLRWIYAERRQFEDPAQVVARLASILRRSKSLE